MANENETWQGLMDSAYAKWPEGGSQPDMMMTLTPAERTAVLLGNLNYQVQNGGFRQWVDNGYATRRAATRRAVLDVVHDPNTTPAEAEIGRKLSNILGRVRRYLKDGTEDRGFMGDYYKSRGAERVFAERSDTWDSWYYEVDEAWGRAVERHLANLAV